FTILAWIDHFDTWYDGFRKKSHANVDVSLELKEGAQYLRTLSKKNKADLEDVARKLEAPYDEAVAFVMSDAFAEIVHINPLIEHPAMPATHWRVLVEHKKANFSTWYELFPR